MALYPKMDEEGEVFTEMIFVVDRSGSMAGSRINSVKDTLQVRSDLKIANYMLSRSHARHTHTHTQQRVCT